MDHTRKKKTARSDVKSKRRKNDSKNNNVSSSSSSCDRDAKKAKKSVRSVVTRNKRKINDVSEVSTSLERSNAETPKPSNNSSTYTFPSSSSKTPSMSTPRKSFSSIAGVKTPCSFYKVTEDEDGKPVFNKSLLKYFSTVDSPEMDDLKNKRWNTSFIHETPKPNREIRIFTEEEDNDPKYFENVPDIDSNLPDVPGSLHADIFRSIPINDSDEELKKVFQEITPVKSVNGRRKRKSTRISCYNGKPLTDDLLSFDYSGLLNSNSFEDNDSDSKENVMDIKIEEA